MKRKDLLARLEYYGAIFLREGGSHTVYENPRTKKNLPVPRHREINEGLANGLIKDAKQ